MERKKKGGGGRVEGGVAVRKGLEETIIGLLKGGDCFGDSTVGKRTASSHFRD